MLGNLTGKGRFWKRGLLIGFGSHVCGNVPEIRSAGRVGEVRLQKWPGRLGEREARKGIVSTIGGEHKSAKQVAESMTFLVHTVWLTVKKLRKYESSGSSTKDWPFGSIARRLGAKRGTRASQTQYTLCNVIDDNPWPNIDF